MLRTALFALCLCVVGIPTALSSRPRSLKSAPLTKAVCNLGEFGTASGCIVLIQKGDGPTHVSGEISGVSPGLHGWHVHEFAINPADSDPCGSAGGHYNPLGKAHGAPHDEERHVGDFGNFRANRHGTAKVHIRDRVVSLVGPYGVIGRTIVIHGGEDDLGRGGDEGSVASGNSGPRVGCCVITAV